MEWLINNWYLIVAAIAVVIAIVVAVKKFLGLPTEQQLDNLKEWKLLSREATVNSVKGVSFAIWTYTRSE